MLTEPSKQLFFEIQLFLRFLFSALLGKPLFHILNSLRQEAVIAQPDELCELSAVKVFRIPRSELASVEAVLVGREQLFNLFAGAVCFQSFKGIANFVAHEDKVPPLSLGFFDLFILEGNLDAFACALHDEEVVDQLLGGRSEFFNTIFQIFLD